MSKQSGLGDNFYIDGYDISGDISSLGGISGTIAPLEVTGIDKYAMERIAGRRDGSMEFTSFFNDNTSPSGAHHVLKRARSGNVIVSYFRGTDLGNPAAAMVAKQLSYDGSMDDDGAFTFEVECQANGYGLEWGIQGTDGKRTDNAAVPASGATAIDNGAASSFGLQAYLHVFSFTGTSCTVKLQESSNNGADAYADVVGGAFAAATGVGAQRIATAADLAVERYLKVVTTGTFSECTFAVIIVRNQSAPRF